MSQEDKLVRVRQKSDTAENWILNNPILLYGELGLEIDTHLIKIGDGITPWSGLPYVLADQLEDKLNKDFSNVSSYLNQETIKTLGIAPKDHSSFSSEYGAATTEYYGHVRTSGMIGRDNYVQSRRASATTTNLNNIDYLYAGIHPITFYINVYGVPSTISEDTGIESSTVAIEGLINTDNFKSASEIDGDSGVKQTLIIPGYNLTYERYWNSRNTGDDYSAWKRMDNKKIECDSLIANSDVKSNGDWILNGYDKNNNVITYATGPLITSSYVGTFQTDWLYTDWKNGRPPYIRLFKNGIVNITNDRLEGSLIDLFPPNQHDIIISFDDTTMENYYSAIAEAGLWITSSGTMAARDWTVVEEQLYEVDLGINITIYYTGGGVL